MDDYKPNSHKFKEEQKNSNTAIKKADKVISGNVKVKKKNEIQKLANVFISEDIKNVKSYVLMDVLIPAIKKAVSDIVTNGIDMILYGGNGPSRKNTNASYVSYRDYSRKDNDRFSSNRSQTKTGYNYDDIILESRGEAEEVLSRMDELIETYGIVSIADMYDLVGIKGNYTDNKYGWSNLSNAEPIRVRDGYLLKLPKALPID